MNKKNESSYSGIFLFISILFVVCILISNIIASKIILVGNISLAAGVLVFPITYIIGDVLTEIYGYKKATKIIRYGFLCNLLMIIIFFIAIKLPYPSFWSNQEAFSTVLSSTPRMFIASLIAYLIGGYSNSFVMAYIKNNSRIKFLWFRTITSTIVGEGLDTMIFITIGFLGVIPFANLTTMILYQALAKILYEIVLTPVTYKVVSFIKKKEALQQ